MPGGAAGLEGALLDHALGKTPAPDVRLPDTRAAAVAAERLLEVPRAENWTWPPRRDAPGYAGPEPVRFAFRRFLAGGHPYRKDDHR